MSSKNKKRPVQIVRPATISPLDEVERLIAKKRLKDALKQSKILFRDHPTPEHHQLLERVYLLRANQLLEESMPASAKEVAYHLLEVGVTDANLFEQATRLLITVGLTREAKEFQGKIESPEVLERLVSEEADLAVVHPNRMLGASDAIRQGGQTIRDAIEAIQNGDEAKGSELLREVSRSSPFADWKLFARGLAANQRGDEADCKANWDRLDPKRAASRIVSGLRRMFDPSRSLPEADEKQKSQIEAVERRVFGASVLKPLEDLSRFITEEDWESAIRVLGPLRPALSRIDPALPERLTQLLYSPLMHEARDVDLESARHLVNSFTRVAQPLRIDPRWNRLWALIWQGEQGAIEQAEVYWRRYAEDLQTLPGLNQEERALGRALIFKHLGEGHAKESQRSTFLPLARKPKAKREDPREASIKQSINCYEESLKLAPGFAPTYHDLLALYEKLNRPDDAVDVARRLVESCPNDFEGLILLAEYHRRREEPDLALEYIRRARALKPLDPSTIDKEWANHVLRARLLALNSHWDEGRAEFELADRLLPEIGATSLGRARKAVFELKAGETKRSEDLIADALASGAHPAAFWLAMRVEAIRYKLPKADRDRCQAQYLAKLSGDAAGDTAAEIAEMLGTYLANKIDYKGSAGDVKDVVGYLKRATKLKYAHDDLVKVCEFLEMAGHQITLLRQFILRGMKLFPDSPVFLLFSASDEMKKKSNGSPIRALRLLEKALALAEASKDPSHLQYLPTIRENLSRARDLVDSVPPFMFGGFGSGELPHPSEMSAFQRMFGEMMGMDFDDDDEYDTEFGDSVPPPSPFALPFTFKASSQRSKAQSNSKPKSKAKSNPNPKKKG